MTDIPAEVMRVARKLAEDWALPEAEEAAATAIAQALLARDKRAAEIVAAESMAYAGLREGVILARAANAILTYRQSDKEPKS